MVDLQQFKTLPHDLINIVKNLLGQVIIVYQDDSHAGYTDISDVADPKRVKEIFVYRLVIRINTIFRPFKNLEVISGNPPIIETRNLSGLFRKLRKLNCPLSQWDTSQVTNMSGMFCGAVKFNQPLDQWDTSRVTNMSAMFRDARVFNQPLYQWDTSQVTDMGGMFTNSYLALKSLKLYTTTVY